MRDHHTAGIKPEQVGVVLGSFESSSVSRQSLIFIQCLRSKSEQVQWGRCRLRRQAGQSSLPQR